MTKKELFDTLENISDDATIEFVANNDPYMPYDVYSVHFDLATNVITLS